MLIDFLTSRNLPAVLTREPGGTDIGQQIRKIILDPQNKTLTPCTELLLYFADRAQHVAEYIRPALAQGMIVISDRYTDATWAYQGYGRGLDRKAIKFLNSFTTDRLKPDITFLLDINLEKGLNRARTNKAEFAVQGQGDRIEQEPVDFYHKVMAGYKVLMKKEKSRFVYIGGEDTIDAIHNRIVETLRERGVL
jgi:dTMP kinase